VSAKTVEFHLGNVYRKLGVNSRTRMALVISEPQQARSSG
jgi:DNA-binding CsgD family transcriptional regulator